MIKDDHQADAVKLLWYIAAASILITLAGAAVLARFAGPQEAVRSLFLQVGSQYWTLHLLQFLLVVYTLSLVLGWIVWTKYEFELLTTYLDFMPFVPAKNYFGRKLLIGPADLLF